MAINNFTASGNLGKDAELRYTQSGSAVSDFSLPVKSGYGDNQKTSWVKCVLWGKVAEAFSTSLKKGILVTISGEYYQEEWEKDGVKRITPCIRVNQIQMSDKSDNKPAQQKQSQSEPPMDFDDDSIPF